MIKRPLNSRFSDAVLSGRKFTTIRTKPWPVGAPIMLYEWSGAPYRSKHTNVAAVSVTFIWPILMHNAAGVMRYAVGAGFELWQTEGFESQAAMDDWFRPLVKPGKTVAKSLMQFKLL